MSDLINSSRFSDYSPVHGFLNVPQGVLVPPCQRQRDTRKSPYGKTVTTADIVRRLGVSTLAVVKWRQGSPTREPLQVISFKRKNANRVLFNETILMEWLEVHRPDLLERWCNVRKHN